MIKLTLSVMFVYILTGLPGLQANQTTVTSGASHTPSSTLATLQSTLGASTGNGSVGQTVTVSGSNGPNTSTSPSTTITTNHDTHHTNRTSNSSTTSTPMTTTPQEASVASTTYTSTPYTSGDGLSLSSSETSTTPPNVTGTSTLSSPTDDVTTSSNQNTMLDNTHMSNQSISPTYSISFQSLMPNNTGLSTYSNSTLGVSVFDTTGFRLISTASTPRNTVTSSTIKKISVSLKPTTRTAGNVPLRGSVTTSTNTIKDTSYINSNFTIYDKLSKIYDNSKHINYIQSLFRWSNTTKYNHESKTTPTHTTLQTSPFQTLHTITTNANLKVTHEPINVLTTPSQTVKFETPDIANTKTHTINSPYVTNWITQHASKSKIMNINTNLDGLTTNHPTVTHSYYKTLTTQDVYTSAHRPNIMGASGKSDTLTPSSRTLQLNASLADSFSAATKALKFHPLENVTDCVFNVTNTTSEAFTDNDTTDYYITNPTTLHTTALPNTTVTYNTSVTPTVQLECTNISKEQRKNVTYFFTPVHTGELVTIFLPGGPFRKLLQFLDTPTKHPSEANETHTEICKHLENPTFNDSYFRFNVSFNNTHIITSLDKCDDRDYGFLYAFSLAYEWSRYQQGIFLTAMHKILQYYDLLRWLPTFQTTIDDHRCKSDYRCKYIAEEKENHFEVKECYRKQQKLHYVTSWGLCNNYFYHTNGKPVAVSQ
ncbi:glycoprotein ORF-O [Proboscivirus elephantidbeta4]|uniref:Glycoprotein ORF-O n=1 Tax=Elephant endotheliotropic herpesvirus 4 TaxID=548914 RepID=A0A0S1TPD3_9BETA|nr:glycoprotein ORF-O [Elephant endotheliotropic herpesvirus 4]ALM26029.1 glycoprotein ORF-O [Elephant endotheliotropic herpesvirus 4]